MKKLIQQRIFKATANLLTITLVAILALVPTSTTASAYETNGLMFYFDFSNLSSTADNASLTDLSGNNRNGTIKGSGLTFDSTDKALDFPGSTSAYVDMGTGFNNFGTGISIEFEGHFGATNQGWERIFDFGNGAGQDNIWVGVLATLSDGTPRPNELAIEIYDGAITKGYCISTGQQLTANQFAKYVITLDGNVCRMYKNGIEINTAKVDNFFSTPDDDLNTTASVYTSLPSSVERTKNYIGKSNWSGDPAFDGAIKYVRIYTEALSPSDVTNNAATYTLTYDTTGSDSGTAPSSKTGNGLITLDGNTGSLVKAGHVFQGWATSANQSTAISGSYNLIADTTLYPAFLPNTYNVTYEENGGSTVSDGTFTHGGTLTFPTNPTRNGYTFLGWFANATGGTALSASTVAAGNTSVTLHAQWAANTYTVSYEENGGSAVADGSYVYGGTLTYPANPTRSGYTFQGWFDAATGGSALSASTVAARTANSTLHAQWAPLPSQTVTWNPTNTSLLTNQSPATPSSLASTNGDGAISYSVVNAGSTGCAVNSSTGVLTFTGVGACVVKATAASTSNYLTASNEKTFNIGSSTPAMSIDLKMSAGDSVTGSQVSYGADGLKANSDWTLVVRSTPQTLASGTFSNSVLAGSAQIPAGLSAGWHSITLTGLSPSGSTISHAIWFEVSATGTLVQTSGTEPTAQSVSTSSPAKAATETSTLPKTGSDFAGQLAASLLLVLFGLMLIRVRRIS